MNNMKKDAGLAPGAAEDSTNQICPQDSLPETKQQDDQYTECHRVGDLAVFKDMPRWLTWAAMPPDKPAGSPRKVPFNVHSSSAASVSDPATWGTFEEARAREQWLRKPLGIGGIGLVLGQIDGDKGLGGIDLDACRDAETGAIEPWGQVVMDRLPIYWEVSPSKTGFKGYFLYSVSGVKANSIRQSRTFKLAGRDPTVRHGPQMEFYLAARWFAVTGERYGEGTLGYISQEQLNWLLEVYGPSLEAREPAPVTEQKPVAIPTAEPKQDFFSNVNTAALANLAAWVPAILPSAKFQPGTKGYRVSSADLGRDLEEDLSLHPDGIKDFGTERGMTAINVVMQFGGVASPLQAARVLTNCMGISPESLGWRDSPARVADTRLDQPAKNERKWPEPLGADAYHGLAGEVVRAIEPHSEADPAALMIQFHVAFGNCIGRRAYYKVEGTRHHSNIFGVLVGQSSKSRKGTSWDRVAEMFEGIGDNWVKTCTHGGMSSGEGLVYPIRDATTKLEKVKGTKEFMTVTDDPGCNDKRLLAQETEFAGALRVMKRDGNTLSRVVRDAWDRDVLEFMTKNSRVRATNPHVSVVGHVTLEELKRELSSTEMANGFANRHLFACAKRSKKLPMGGSRSPEMIAVALKVKAAVEAQRAKSTQNLGQMLAGKSTNNELTWTDEARLLWCELYADLSEGHPGMFGAVTGRAEAQVVRLSLIYALLDGADAIGIVHLRAGLAVWRYCEQSAAYIWGDALGDDTADTILRALRDAGEDGLTRTQISALFKGHKPASELERALAVLSIRKLAAHESRGTGGRSEETWRALSS